MSRRRLSWSLKLGLSGVVMGLIVHHLPLHELLATARGAHPGYVLLGILAIVPNFYLKALQLYWVARAQHMSVSVRQILGINLATQFYGLFLPGYLAGGAIRWYKLSGPERKVDEALAVIVYNRLVEFTIVVLLGLFFWADDDVARANSVFPLVFLGVLGGLIGIAALLFSVPAAAALRRLLDRFKLDGWRALARDRLYRLLTVARRFDALRNRELFYVVGASLSVHLLGILSTVLIAHSLMPWVSFASLGWVRSLLILVLALPLGWAGLGIREGSLIFLLSPYGVTPQAAVTLGLLLLLRDLIGAVLGALLEARGLWMGKRARDV